MQYTRKFLINGKNPEEFTEGTVEEVIFTDVETKKEFKSFIDMVKDFGFDTESNIATTESIGTESYHNVVVPFVEVEAKGKSYFLINTWTDGVDEFIEKNNTHWLMDIIGSYLNHCSSVVRGLEINEENIERRGGKIEYLFLEKKEDEEDTRRDSFISFRLVKLSDTTAMVTFEIDGDWNEEIEDVESISIATQFIPFTDIQFDNVQFFIESGVTLFPQEH